jgi:MFS family permease
MASDTEQPVTVAAPPPPTGLTRVWVAVGVSSLGDGAFLAAIPLAAAAITRSPTQVAAVTAAMYLPWFLVQPFAGALLERWPFRATMLTADFLRAAGVAALAVLVGTAHATIPLLAIAAFAMVLGQIFHDGAVQATVPELAGRTGATLDRINGRVYTAETGGKQLIGPPLGSAGFALLSWLPFTGDALSFVVSGLLLWQLPKDLRTPRDGDHPPLLRAVWEGMVWLARHTQLRLAAIVVAGANFAYNCAWATFVLLATVHTGLNISPAGFGLFISAYAVGGVVTGPFTGRLNRLLGPTRAMVLLAVAHALAWPLIAVSNTAWAAAPLLAVIGAAQTMTTVTNVGLRQALAPAGLLNRVTAAVRTLANSASPLGAIIGGVVASIWGLRAPLYLAGAILLVVALATAPALVRRSSTPA